MNDQSNVSKDAYSEDSHKRAPKRARASASNQNTPKKRVKGKQGGLQGIMKMPIEIFMEIAPYVNPGDLISLIRTSKFFRAMLLERSAASVWQRSLNNVPDLPPCPTGMAEPQYAALMFTKNCTICGIQAISSKPDPYLQVRLCHSCRDKELAERSAHYFFPGSGNIVPYTSLIKMKKPYYNNPVYVLRAQELECERMRTEFRYKDDREAGIKWFNQREAAWKTQKKEGDRLLEYINSAAESRSSELRDLKSERQEQIHERLKALGWDEVYFNFSRGSNSAIKQWRALVEVAKPLTERTWTNILPKLIELLDENRPQVEEYERGQRKHERISVLQKLLFEFDEETNPCQPIISALQQSSTSNGPGNRRTALSAPFPSESVLSGWDFIRNVYMEEHSLTRVEELFNERRGMISQKLAEWRTKVEDQLVKQYLSLFIEGTDSRSTTLTIKGSSDATKDLSENSRFLLRADTVFMEAGIPTCYIEVDQEHGPICDSVHFPDIRPIQNYAYFRHYQFEADLNHDNKELQAFVRHAGKEVIIKALLKQLDMPDVSHVELKQMGKVFICGRCNHDQLRDWHEIVEHYHLKRREWVGGKHFRDNFATKHPIVLRSAHDLAPGASSQPFVRIGTSADTSSNAGMYCLICYELNSYRTDDRFDSMERMKGHMIDIHDTTELVEGLHFLPYSGFVAMFYNIANRRASWEEKWDKYYAAQSTSNEEAAA